MLFNLNHANFVQINGTLTIEDLLENSTLLIQIADVRSDGGVSRLLLNETVTISVTDNIITEHVESLQADSK